MRKREGTERATRAGAASAIPGLLAPSPSRTTAILDGADAVFAALEGSPLPTTFVGADGLYRFVNRSYERWFGLRWEEAVGRGLVEVIGAEAARAVTPFFNTALAGGTVEFESLLPYKRRGPRRMRIVYAAARAPDGSVPGFFAFLEDITARRDAEMAVTAALDGIADGYMTLDAHLRFTHVNRGAEALFGRTASQMVGRHIDEVTPGSSRGAVGELIREVIDGSGPQRRELPSIAAPGRRLLVDVLPLLTGGVSIVFQDVTELRRQEEELRLAHARFEAAARASLGVVYEWNPQTGTVWRSEGLRHLFGVSPEEAGDQASWWTDRIHPEDHADTLLYLDSLQDVGESRYRVRHADGSWRTVLDRALAVRDPQGRVVRVIGAAFDITSQAPPPPAPTAPLAEADG